MCMGETRRNFLFGLFFGSITCSILPARVVEATITTAITNNST